jgi:isoamylase
MGLSTSRDGRSLPTRDLGAVIPSFRPPQHAMIIGILLPRSHRCPRRKRWLESKPSRSAAVPSPLDRHNVYRPYQSINLVAAHDGFCLYDLVAYEQKHNEANGHGNRDGALDNRSWNCGREGDEGVPAEVLTLRHRQIKNFFSLLMLANGTPMFCAGDEFCNTQRGNNNPYNQDNETTWLDWSRLEPHRDMFRFFRQMIALRKSRRSIGRSRYWRQDVHWYGAQGPVDFSPESRSLAYCLVGERFEEGDLYVMINAYWEPVRFHIQESRARDWKRLVDTSRVSPEDIAEPGNEWPVGSPDYEVAPRSVVVLERKTTEAK